MRVALLKYNRTPQIEEQITLAATHGIQIDMIALRALDMTSLEDSVDMKKLASYDVVHYYASANPAISWLLNEKLQGKTALVNMDELCLRTANDKAMQAVFLKGKLRTPQTLTASHDDTYETISSILGETFVLKKSSGAHGEGVFLVHSSAELQALQQELRHCDAMIYQEFIAYDGDFRVHVIGGTAIYANRRVPRADDFRANLAQGGSMEAIHDPELLKRLYAFAEKAATLLHYDIAGVDIVQSSQNGELYFIEINRNPGTKNIQELLSINPEKALVDYYETHKNPLE